MATWPNGDVDFGPMAVGEQTETLNSLTALVRDFANARDWEQFHTIRNLILALVGEVGELAAEVQWINDTEVASRLRDPAAKEQLAAELADVLTYLLRLADVAEVDLADSLKRKLDLNNQRYPVESARGSSQKYTAYE